MTASRFPDGDGTGLVGNRNQAFILVAEELIHGIFNTVPMKAAVIVHNHESTRQQAGIEILESGLEGRVQIAIYVHQTKGCVVRDVSLDRFGEISFDIDRRIRFDERLYCLERSVGELEPFVVVDSAEVLGGKALKRVEEVRLAPGSLGQFSDEHACVAAIHTKLRGVTAKTFF